MTGSRPLVLVILSLGSCAALACMGGCRESDPPRPYNRDLGDDGAILLPPAEPLHDPSINSGSGVQWREAVPEQATEADTPDEAAGDAAESDEHAELKAELRELITELNEVTAEYPDGEDDPAEYYVERQQENVRKLLDVHDKVSSKLETLRSIFADASPEGVAAVEELLGGLALFQKTTEVASITVTSESEAVGHLALDEPLPPGVIADIKFVLADDEWFVEDPAIDALAAVLPMFEPMVASLDTMIAALQSGQMTPQQGAEQLATLATEGLGGLDAASEDNEGP